jgi:hypothetical protein
MNGTLIVKLLDGREFSAPLDCGVPEDLLGIGS